LDYKIDTTEIFKNVDIFKVIGRYLKLDIKGNRAIALCPFHQDNNPSLHISKDKQIFKCFVCNTGGNAVTFVKNYEHISYFDAVRKVCEISNIDIPKELKKPIVTSKYASRYEMMQLINDFFLYNALTTKKEEVKSYFEKRKITKEDMSTFGIGYTGSNYQGIYNLLKNKGYDEKRILETGLVRENNGQIIDNTKNRVTFQICNEDGKTVSFSMRSIDGTGEKYLLTATSEIFTKANILYNYHLAIKEIQPYDRKLIVVEGFMDAIAVYKSGYKNVVALLGTDCSEHNLELIKKLNVTVIIALDNDNAGKTATIKLANKLHENGIEYRIIGRIKTKDLDETYVNYGGDEVVKAIENSYDINEYCFNEYIVSNIDSNINEKEKMIFEMLNILTRSSEIIAEDYLGRIAKTYNIDLVNLKKEFLKIKKLYKSTKNNQQHLSGNLGIFSKYQENKYFPVEEKSIHGMIKDHKYISIAKKQNVYYTNEIINILFKYILHHYAQYRTIELNKIIDDINQDQDEETAQKAEIILTNHYGEQIIINEGIFERINYLPNIDNKIDKLKQEYDDLKKKHSDERYAKMEELEKYRKIREEIINNNK